MKYKIILPFSLDGARYGLSFYKGEAVTDNKALAGRLKLRGVRIEEVEDDYTIKSIKGIALGEKKSPGNAVPLTDNPEGDIDSNSETDDIDDDVDLDGESDDINSDDECDLDDDIDNDVDPDGESDDINSNDDVDSNDETDDLWDTEFSDISGLSIKELKQFALDNKIDLTGVPNKKESLISFIELYLSSVRYE